MVNQTRAVDKGRLVKLLGSLPAELMAKVKAALRLHYDI
jgi:mRNA-degrading endonuclease toxin of MazEF toxin-antitoxin module